jgi:hypothetical protein
MNLSDVWAGPDSPSRASGWGHALHRPRPPVLRRSPSAHAVATTPAGPQVGSIRSPGTCDSGLPHLSAGSAPAFAFSRPARRSLALRPAHSLSRSHDPLTSEASDRKVTSTAAPTASGWSESCQVGLTPTEKRHLCTAHRKHGTQKATSEGGMVSVRVPHLTPSWRA